MPTIEIYSKPDCSLCDKAKEILLQFQSEFSLEIKEFNIETDAGIFELYKEKIPVIKMNGEVLFYGRISESALRRKLQELGR